MSEDHPHNTFFSSQDEADRDNVYLDIAKSKDNWRKMAFIIGLYAFLATGALVTRAFQSKYRPYVVKVNELGKAVDFGPAESLKKNDDRLIRAQLFQWLQHMRSVHGDRDFLNKQMEKGFAMVSGDVSDQLNDYFSVSDHDPRNLIGEYRRSLEIRSIAPTNDDRTDWKFEWIETLYSKDSGQPIKRQEWVGYATIKTETPESSEGILKNPLGIYITSLSWQPNSPQKKIN